MSIRTVLKASEEIKLEIFGKLFYFGKSLILWNSLKKGVLGIEMEGLCGLFGRQLWKKQKNNYLPVE